MRENTLLKYLSKEEKEKYIYSQMHLLREDLVFLKMLVNRNTKSIFGYDIIPNRGMCRNFLRELYLQYYYCNNEESDILLTEYEVVKKMFYIIDNNEINDEEKTMIKEIYNYFSDHYEMNISNYVDDFIGCSRGCCCASSIVENIVNDAR